MKRVEKKKEKDTMTDGLKIKFNKNQITKVKYEWNRYLHNKCLIEYEYIYIYSLHDLNGRLSYSEI